MIKAILFDLDGTLLPMEEDKYIKAYFSLLYNKVKDRGYSADKLFGAIWKSFDATVINDGSRFNEDVFWDVFSSIMGTDVIKDKPVFDLFYSNEYNQAASSCGFEPKANATVKKLKELGYTVILATNPVFPSPATSSRIKWAGMDVNDFSLVTTYENSSFCKPNVKYYEEILSKMNLCGDECIMIGNDAEEDMVASKLGLDVFLLTNCLINRKNVDINQFPHGNFDSMWKFLDDKLSSGFDMGDMHYGK